MNSDPLDILNQDLAAVDLTPTVPKHGTRVEMTCTKAEVVTTKADDPMLSLSFETIDSCTAHNKDDSIEPGYRGVYMVWLARVNKDGKDRSETIKKALKRTRRALTGDETGAFNPVEQYVGCTVTAKWEVEESEQYGTQGRIVALSEVVPAAE